MTAEVVIFNNQGIALAADSAVTIGRERVWKHANKIFSAGPANDMGVMIYNSGNFIGFPWEVVVKEHRRRVGLVRFPTVAEYAASLIDFLKSDVLKNDEQEEVSIQLLIVNILEEIHSACEESDSDNPIASLSEVLANVESELDLVQEVSSTVAEEVFAQCFQPSVNELFLDIFSEDIVQEERILNIFYRFVNKQSESDYSTGLVVAGFGEQELFPCVSSYIVDGKFGDFTRVWKTDASVDLNGSDRNQGGIFPFAQKDMAYLFVEGIYPKYFRFLKASIDGLLRERSISLIEDYIQDDDTKKVELARQERENKKIVDTFFEEFAKYRQEEFVDHLIDTVSALPKEEMAFMAKAMVELTALRRKFTSTVETVGGAIDVAIISKSDGFIWMNRKHYFDLDFNKDFLDRKRVSMGGIDATHGRG